MPPVSIRSPARMKNGMASRVNESTPPKILDGMSHSGSSHLSLWRSGFVYSVAIPFFILAGDLMDTGGISRRLVTLARVLVGHVRGGLGMVVVVGEIFFSGISGSTTADAQPSDRSCPGHDPDGLYPRAGSRHRLRGQRHGNTGAPLSHDGRLWKPHGGLHCGPFAAALPAAVMAIMLIVQLYIQARRDNLPREPRASWRDIGRALREAGLALDACDHLRGVSWAGSLPPPRRRSLQWPTGLWSAYSSIVK